MTKRVVFSSAAARDMVDVVEWLTQPGSGPRAHGRLVEIQKQIARLPDDVELFIRDPDKTGSRLALLHGYAVRFKLRRDGSVWIERVFGPGQRR